MQIHDRGFQIVDDLRLIRIILIREKQKANIKHLDLEQTE